VITKPPPARRSNLTDGISIIRLILKERHGLGVTQVAEALNTPKSSTYRVLQTLCQLGFVERHVRTNRYTVNPAIFDFVHDLASHFGKNRSLEQHIHATAEKLNCGICLCMLGDSDTYVICAAGLEFSTTHLGAHGPAFTTSAGKILVAQLDEKEWGPYAPKPGDVAPTKFSNLEPKRFYEQLREVRRVGFAWNRRESSMEYVSVAAAVREPFVYRARLAVALLFRHERVSLLSFGELEEAVLRLAAELETQLGMPVPARQERHP
jgi:DNA-binding IclR family transcriptional regulator